MLQALNFVTNYHEDLQCYSISNSQWSTLKNISDFLEIFNDLSVKMSSGAYVTVFHVIPYFNLMIDHVEDRASTCGDGAVARLKDAATSAREKLVQYYSKTNITTMLCTVLDPRRKFYYFKRKEFPEEEITETKQL